MINVNPCHWKGSLVQYHDNQRNVPKIVVIVIPGGRTETEIVVVFLSQGKGRVLHGYGKSVCHKDTPVYQISSHMRKLSGSVW